MSKYDSRSRLDNVLMDIAWRLNGFAPMPIENLGSYVGSEYADKLEYQMQAATEAIRAILRLNVTRELVLQTMRDAEGE